MLLLLPLILCEMSKGKIILSEMWLCKFIFDLWSDPLFSPLFVPFWSYNNPKSLASPYQCEHSLITHGSRTAAARRIDVPVWMELTSWQFTFRLSQISVSIQVFLKVKGKYIFSLGNHTLVRGFIWYLLREWGKYCPVFPVIIVYWMHSLAFSFRKSSDIK